MRPLRLGVRTLCAVLASAAAVGTASAVAADPTTTVVSITPDPVVAGQPATFTATVSATTGTPTGTVQFADDTSATSTTRRR